MNIQERWEDVMPNKQVVFCFAIIMFTIILAPYLFAATPFITEVSGTVINGSILTIKGQYLMDEDKTNWLSMFKSGTAYGFEGSSYEADGYSLAPDEMVHGTRGYDTNVKLSGNKSIYGRVTYSGKTGAGYVHEVSGQDLYVRFYTRWHSAGSWKWPDSYIKMTMSGGSYGDQMYYQPSYGSGPSYNQLPTTVSMVWDSTTHEYSVSNFLQDNRWYCMEARYKTSSPTNFTAWLDNSQVHSTSTSSVGTTTFLWFGMINMCCQGSGFDLTNWIDNYTVSTSRIYCSSIVEIGNNSNYAAATKVYQAPVYLSDNSIQVKVDLTGLGDGPYYLWVTNNRQERSSAYALSGGGGNPPSPPFGLRVVE